MIRNWFSVHGTSEKMFRGWGGELHGHNPRETMDVLGFRVTTIAAFSPFFKRKFNWVRVLQMQGVESIVILIYIESCKWYITRSATQLLKEKSSASKLAKCETSLTAELSYYPAILQNQVKKHSSAKFGRNLLLQESCKILVKRLNQDVFFFMQHCPRYIDYRSAKEISIRL